MEQFKDVVVTGVCPRTNETVKFTVFDVNVAGQCANEEYPSTHYLDARCPSCQAYHALN